MIANFFQSLERERVQYLLISGQAAVLYGAAVFSEDIDLWVEPSEANLRAFTDTLHSLGACYYKLTPPLRSEFAQRGHGFHFILPGEELNYLDVMGVPPRVGTFDSASARASRMETDWGTLAVIGIPDLIELKKTQRLEDYPVIGRLTLEFVRKPEVWSRQFDQWFARSGLDAGAHDNVRLRGRQLLDWALEHVFTLESFSELLAEPGLAWSAYDGRFAEEARSWRAELSSPAGLSERTGREVTERMQRRVAELQAQDREYWKPVIRELKHLREKGRLVPVDSPV